MARVQYAHTRVTYHAAGKLEGDSMRKEVLARPVDMRRETSVAVKVATPRPLPTRAGRPLVNVNVGPEPTTLRL